MAYTGSVEMISDFLSFTNLVDDHDQNLDKGLSLTADRGFAELNVDYKKFSNHCWFNSAYTKAYNAINRIQTQLEDDATTVGINDFYYSGTHFDRHIYDTYPRQIGYASFEESQYVSGSDSEGMIVPGSGSWTMEGWMKPVGPSFPFSNTYLFHASGNTEQVVLYWSAMDQNLYCRFDSASTVVAVNAQMPQNEWSYFSVIVDEQNSTLSLYTGTTSKKPRLATSTAYNLGPLYAYDSNSSAFYFASGNYTNAVGAFSGCLDEIRIWRSALSASFMYDYFNTHIYPEHKDLVLYYKFNKGGTGTGSVDSQVRDYSGNDLDAYIGGYATSSRVSGTALQQEEGTPLPKQHSRTSVWTTEWLSSGSIYDNHNDQLITKQFPQFVIDDDDNLSFTKYVYIMAEMLDELQLYQEHLVNLTNINYQGKDSCPDELLPQFAENKGFKLSPVFEGGTALQQFFGENVLSTGSVNYTVDDLKKEVWRRIANNITYYNKSKGTHRSWKGLLNAIGLDERQIKIKQYSFLPGEKIDDQRIYSYRAIPWLPMYDKQEVIVDDVNAVGTRDYTFEVAVKPDTTASFTTGAIMYVYFDDAPDRTQHASLEFRKDEASGTVLFTYASGSTSFEISSSQIPMWTDDRYHVAIARKSGVTTDGVELYLYWGQYDVDRVRYSGSSSITIPSASYDLGDPSVYIGANSGATIEPKGWFSEWRYYGDCLNYNEFKSHIYDLRGHGTYEPLERSASMRIPLDNVAQQSSQVVWFDDVIGRGRAVHTASASGVDPLVSKTVYFQHLSQDLVWSEDLVRIRDQKEISRSQQAIDNGIVSLEMNPVDAINEDIGRMFSSNRVYNEIFGKPVNKLRDRYTDLYKYRSKYFDNFVAMMKIYRYFDALRWVDKNISDMVEQLVGAKKKYFGSQFVIEPHILEINKATQQYSIFKTPTQKDMGEVDVVAIPSSSKQVLDKGNIEVLTSTGSFDGFKSYKDYRNVIGVHADPSEAQDPSAGASYDRFYERDGFNLQHASYVNSGTDAVSAGRTIADTDDDFELMNLHYYYDLKVMATGSFFEDFNGTIDAGDDTEVLELTVVPTGWRTKQFEVYYRMNKDINSSVWDPGVTVTLIDPVVGDTYVMPVKFSADGLEISGSRLFSPRAIALTEAYGQTIPEVEIAGAWTLQAEGCGAPTEAYQCSEWTIDFDIHTTASIINSDLYWQAGHAATAKTALGIDHEERKYVPEDTWMIHERVYTQAAPSTYSGNAAVGGVHYANMGGMLFDQIYGGTQQLGKMGITDADMIQVFYTGSQMVVLWPNQLELSDRSKKFMLNNAFTLELSDSKDAFTPGKEYFLDDEYDAVTLWIYNKQYEDYDNSDPADTVHLDIRVMESPTHDGPLSYVPMISGTHDGSTYNAELTQQYYFLEYLTSEVEERGGWISTKIELPLKSIKRLRIDVKGDGSSLTDPNKPLNNAIIFGQFMKKGVMYTDSFDDKAKNQDYTDDDNPPAA